MPPSSGLNAICPAPQAGTPGRRLIVATQNRAKGRELIGLLAGVPFQVVLLADVPGVTLPPEGTTSYADNAVRKARSVARLAGALALADDSGIEVDALGGAPGVLSARFGGTSLTDAQRCAALLERLRGVPGPRRTARFRCVVALASADGREEIVEGRVEGLITTEPRGPHGFGYDPVFLYPPLGRTFGELSPVAKAEVSHRAVAVGRAAELLRRW
jgi:XTP/dITP diphosphohydrolase